MLWANLRVWRGEKSPACGDRPPEASQGEGPWGGGLGGG